MKLRIINSVYSIGRRGSARCLWSGPLNGEWIRDLLLWLTFCRVFSLYTNAGAHTNTHADRLLSLRA